MLEERAERFAELVKSALELDPLEWPAFLDEECGSDPAMRAEIESLLQQQDGASRFIEKPALHIAAESLMREGAFRTGQTIGDYEIVSLIGSGGMGEVYLAQDRQLHRKVALKLIRRGLDSENLVHHFKREEHLLASLNHPNIAQLYGGGVTADGIPFFAMEYVDGQRLDEYCDERGLGTKERLQLFRKVCAAVTYAHQHLVIHRDLKPANIRVTPEGEPKLLDFGIAKLLDSENAQSSGQTLTLQGVMTPEYASPEQVRGETMTTASDVYSLGVVLYKLLTGQGPYRTKTTRPDEIARAITEQEPTRPSTAIAKGDGNSRNQIQNAKFLRGDLDNVLLMALRKEPQRRYSSVAQFSEDIRRHLDGLPVIARKDTFQYRSTKFIKRHRVGVAAAVLILVSLIGGIVATLWQAHMARQEGDKAEEIKNFLERTLSYSSRRFTAKNDRETTLTEVLDEAAKRLESGEFSDQREVRAELEGIIAGSYLGEGKMVSANKHLEESVQLQNGLYGENDPRAIDALAGHAWLLFSHGELTASERIYRKVLPGMRLEQKKGRIKAASLASALNTFAFLRRTQGDSKEAESLFRETLTLSAQISADEWHFHYGTTRSTLASTLADQGRFEEALQTSREAVTELRQRRETDMPNFGFDLTVLGGLLTEKGDYVEADASLQEAEANIRRFFLEPSNLWIGDNLRNQAISFYQQGRYADSLRKVTEALKIYRQFGTHYDNYPTALIIHGLILAKTDQPKEGEGILREAVKIRTESLPKEHYWVAQANSALGECLAIEKRYQEAEPLLFDSYESLKKSQGVENPRTKLALQRLINLYEAWNKPDQATRYRALLPAPKP